MQSFEPWQALHMTLVLQLLGGLTSVTAAVVAILSFRTIRTSAAAARSSAEIAAYNSRHAEIVRVQEHFENSLFFMKLWHIELATGERSLNADPAIAALLGDAPLEAQEVRYKLRSYASDDPRDTLYVSPDLERFAGSPVEAVRFAECFAEHAHRYEAEDVIRECFGPPHSATSADLLAVYSLARSLCAWVDTHAGEDRAARVSEITDMFRRELVITLSRHRAFVGRLFRGAPSEAAFEYFREHYGLRDPDYTRLFDELLLDADQRGLLTDDHRREIATVETWLASEPRHDPLRGKPFPRPGWVAPRGRIKRAKLTHAA